VDIIAPESQLTLQVNAKEMKPILQSLLAVRGGIFVWAVEVNAQSTLTPSEYNALVSAVENTTPQPASSAPAFGNFYAVTHGESWPPLPGDAMGLDYWPLGGGYYLLDDRNYDYSAVHADSGYGWLFPTNGGSGGSGGSGPDFTPQYTSNDLYLKILGVTSNVASLEIHEPPGVTAGVYDLLFRTNPQPPETWHWVLRTDPGQTNLAVSNAFGSEGFYALGKPNDFVANDSLGTNFWLAFPTAVSTDGDNLFSLYISSPVTTTGIVTVPNQLNGNVLVVTNSGDTNVNGTYLLTNISVDPTDYGISGDAVRMRISRAHTWSFLTIIAAILTMHMDGASPTAAPKLFYLPAFRALVTCSPTLTMRFGRVSMIRPAYLLPCVRKFLFSNPSP
jgi:hypothetical protein